MKKHRLLFDEEALQRGALVEVKAVLETHASFQFSAVFEALAGMIAEKPDFFGMNADEMEDGMFFKRILDRPLVNLVPLRAVVVDYAAVTLSGRRFIVHRDLCERLAAAEPDREGEVQPVPLHVVGVAEESLFWKDIRRVLFSRAEFLVPSVQAWAEGREQLEPDEAGSGNWLGRTRGREANQRALFGEHI